MSLTEIIQTPCGQECTSYLIEGDYACMRCLEIQEQDELRAEADFFSEMEGIR